MGIFKSTAIARMVENSVDELTFCLSRGRKVVKTKISVNKSRTLLQQQQRTRWRELQRLDTVFDEAILIGFPSRPQHFTTHNAFVKANGQAVEVSEDLTVTTDYTKILCSQGRLKTPQVSVTADAGQHELTFTSAQEQAGKRSQPTDQLYVLVVEKALQESQFLPLGTRAEQNQVTVSIPENWKVAELAVYAFAVTANGSMASDSKYVEVK